MTKSTASLMRRLTSAPGPRTRHRGVRGAVVLLLRLAAVALLAWIGYIHLHLWQEGYRQIPTDGPFFLLDAVAASVFAAALLVWPRPLAGLLAAGFTASTIGALLISLTVGLFGFNESIGASFVVESLVIEGIAVVLLLLWTVLIAAGLPAADARVRQDDVRGDGVTQGR
jgi:hypothetical protein